MRVLPQDLKVKNTREEYEIGYRIIYIYGRRYTLGEYSQTIEGFMKFVVPYRPDLTEDDIPKFKSISDLLNRLLADMEDANGVALYKIQGRVCLGIKKRKKEKKEEIKN